MKQGRICLRNRFLLLLFPVLPNIPGGAAVGGKRRRGVLVPDEEAADKDRMKMASSVPTQATPAPRAILAPFSLLLPEGAAWYIL